MGRHKLFLSFFGLLAAFFLFAFLAWTALPYWQMTNYVKKSIQGRVSEIVNSKFIFSPYTCAQSYLRSDLLTYFLRVKITAGYRPLFARSIALMEGMLAREGYDPSQYVRLARAYAKTGDAVRAERSFQKALTFSPRRQELFLAYITFLLEQKRDEEARAMMKQTLALGEQNMLSHFYYGLTLMTAGETVYPEALDHLERFFIFDEVWQGGTPDVAWAQSGYKKLLQYFYKKQDRERVLVVARRLMALDEEQSESYRQIAETIKNTGQIPVINFAK
ncbi:MAG: tetratricopeptide repeat protein [Candidatus Doudnabacteria bacterium]|nr:tetratricopeptide repeat protein [Candidatus Doudnabacteria bacterium]